MEIYSTLELMPSSRCNFYKPFLWWLFNEARSFYNENTFFPYILKWSSLFGKVSHKNDWWNWSEQYYDNPESAFRRDWDVIQIRLRCCGFATYMDHLNKNSKNKTTCVPESCCRKITATGECSQIGEISGDCPKLRGQAVNKGNTILYES